MADPFLAEIRVFGFNFAPRGWALCNGQLLPISQNTALFALLGTSYGGDGRTTFGLPDLQDATALHSGYDQPSGLTYRTLGEQGGAEAVTLIATEMPAHTHQVRVSDLDGDLRVPGPNRALARTTGALGYSDVRTVRPSTLYPSALGVAGGSQPHENLMPSVTMTYCIALQGIFPPRW